MGLLRYIIQGFGWQVGSDLAKEARDGLTESAEDAERRDAERARTERAAAAEREKGARAAAKAAEREKQSRDAQVEKDLAVLKRKLENGGR